MVATKTGVEVQLTGTDGNIFSLLSKASKAMENAGFEADARAMALEVLESGSYEQALQVIMKYVKVS